MERENSNFPVEKTGRHHLTQVIQVTSPVISHVDSRYPPHDMIRALHPCGVLPPNP